MGLATRNRYKVLGVKRGNDYLGCPYNLDTIKMYRNSAIVAEVLTFPVSQPGWGSGTF